MRGKTIAIFIEKLDIGVCVFNEQDVRIQCSEIKSSCYPAFPLIQNLIRACNTVISNNFLHELFSNIDLEQINTEIINEKSLVYEAIEHHLIRISSHLTEATNLSCYFKQFYQYRVRFNALGMILGFLSNKHSPKVFIEDIDFFSDTLLESVRYTRNQLEYLEISKEDLHPSLIKGKGNSKEGYSIISAYQAFLASSGSKKILRYIILNPTFNRPVLEGRYQVIRWMKATFRDAKFGKYFRGIHSLEGILKSFGRMNVDEQQWRKLMKTLQSMLQVRKMLSIEDAPSIASDYFNDPSWEQIIDLLHAFKSTLQLSPIGIKNGVDRTLDQLKKTYDNMPHLLTLIAKDQEWQVDFRIVFMAQVGYLIKISHDTELPEALESNEWTLQISNSSGKFYSNSLTQALDNEYGDLYGQIQDIEKKIIFELQSLVVERESILLKLYWQVCQIQCFWGISQLSKSMSEPRLSSEALIVCNGWHPLLTGDVIHNHAFSFCQASAPKHSVYNSEQNLVNTNYSNRCVVITGPNASGKTVYMKQLAVIIYLAHCGLFVPTTFAQIPLIDSMVFVGKSQSIYTDQVCGFKSQLVSLSSIAMPNIISNKALILMDELGAEIDYENSLKLLYTTIDYLTSPASPLLINRVLSKPRDEFKTPLVLIVTHLSEILRSSILEENYLVRFLTMQVEEGGLHLFKIKPGLVRKGYGIRAAAQILPQSIIASAQKYLDLISQLD